MLPNSILTLLSNIHWNLYLIFMVETQTESVNTICFQKISIKLAVFFPDPMQRVFIKIRDFITNLINLIMKDIVGNLVSK